MSKSTLFSVIMPTFNRAHFLEKAIRSVLDQSFTDFELIIVDDGSEDNTPNVLDKFKDPRVHYYKKENEERNIARNFGVQKANSKFICFLDSDDYYYPYHLTTAFELVTSNPAINWFYLPVERRDINGKKLPVTPIPHNSYSTALIRENFILINGIVLKKEILTKYPFIKSQNAIVGEDQYLWLRLISRFPLLIARDATSVTIEHENRSLRSIDLKKLTLGTEEIIQDLKNDHLFMDFYSHKSKWYFSFLQSFIATVAIEQLEFIIAKKYLLKSLKVYNRIIFNKRFLAAVKYLLK